MYHHVNPTGNLVNVTPGRFEAQMRCLSRWGYRTVQTGELLEILSCGEAVPPKTVMITFDDGWLDNWLYAFPILKKYGLKAVLFVVTSWICDRPPRREVQPLPGHRECMRLLGSGRGEDLLLSWQELKEMEDSGLIDVQSHTHGHRRWDGGYGALRDELSRSKEMIEERLEKPCIGLCWPWGMDSPVQREAAMDAGFRLLFTTRKGCNSGAGDLSALKRVVIGNIGPLGFRKKLYINSRPWLSGLYLRVFGRGDG